jgi:O-antigen/teichoic acid export membrane protein
VSTIRKNVVANYVSQIYMAVIGIVLMPYYLRLMGAEAYGLIGFYSMLQGWFMLLDVGMTPTMIREAARFRGGSLDALTFRRFVRALEGIFFGAGTIASLSIMACSRLIATDWLKVQKLPIVEVQHVIMLIAAIISIRWVSLLYKGAVNGFERLVWLGGLNIVTATLRFVLVIPALFLLGTTPTVFFSYQVIVAFIELIWLIVETYKLLPALPSGEHLSWDLKPLKGVLGFSLTIAVTSSTWVVVTQTDKLLLSKFLPLSMYAYFTLAVLLASGVNLLSGPISGALLPRMVKLQAEGDQAGMLRLYRNATQMVAVIAVPASLILAFFSRQILQVWTANATVAHSAAPVLTLYALGNGLLALGSFPFFLQFAMGDLKLHLIGSLLFTVALIPTLIWATLHYGMVGAGYAWVGANSVYFICWIPTVHRRFVKGLHREWLLNDVAAIVILSAGCTILMRHLVSWPNTRIGDALLVLLLSGILVAIAAAASSWVRQKVVRQRA